MKLAVVLLSLSLISNAEDAWRVALDRANGLRLSDATGAKREFQNAARLAETTGSESQVAVWMAFSDFLIKQNNCEEADIALRKALALQNQTGIGGPIGRATILHGLARARQGLGRREESIDLLRKAIALMEATPGADKVRMVASLNLLSSVYVETGRISEARTTIERAMTVARPLGDNIQIANAWIVLSELERIAGNYDEARRAARNALKGMVSPTTDNSPIFERAHNQLARIACETFNYRAAADHWKLTLDALRARRPESDSEILSVRTDIARMAVEQGRLGEAEKDLTSVIDVAERHGGQTALGYGLYALGLLYVKQKQFDKARPAFVRSLTIFDKEFGELSTHSALCVANLAGIYLKASQPAEAVELSGRAERLSGGDDAVVLPWLDVIQIHAQVLRKLNRKSEAKEFHERASRLFESRRSRNQTIDVMDLR